jgi:hypothetical protein
VRRLIGIESLGEIEAMGRRFEKDDWEGMALIKIQKYVMCFEMST